MLVGSTVEVSVAASICAVAVSGMILRLVGDMHEAVAARIMMNKRRRRFIPGCEPIIHRTPGETRCHG